MLDVEDHIQWNQANHTAPAKPDPTQTEQGIVQSVCSSFDSGKHLGVIFRQAGRDGFAPLLGLFPKGTT